MAYQNRPPSTYTPPVQGPTPPPGTTTQGVDPVTGLPVQGPAPVAAPATPPGPGDPFMAGDTGAGLAPMTGFASRYTPAMASQAYENPWYLLGDVFPGMNESSPLYQALRDFGADPLTLYNIIQGGNQKIDQGSGNFINFMNEFYKEMGTPGGQNIDTNALIGTLFGQNAFGADSQNTLGQILGAGDMSTQVRTLFNMLRDVSNAGMNPLAARGYQAAVAQAGDRYGNAQMKAGADSTMNPTQWISQNMPWLAGR
jgi:hypothetical protein